MSEIPLHGKHNELYGLEGLVITSAPIAVLYIRRVMLVLKDRAHEI